MNPVALMSSSLKPFVMRRSSVRVRSEAPAIMSNLDTSTRKPAFMRVFSFFLVFLLANLPAYWYNVHKGFMDFKPSAIRKIIMRN